MTSITSAPLQSADDVLVVRVEGLIAQKGTTGQFVRLKRYPRGGAAAEESGSIARTRCKPLWTAERGRSREFKTKTSTASNR